MSYGDPRWQQWVLPHEEAVKHIKFAYVRHLCLPMSVTILMCKDSYDHGITTFDTANIYSHGASEAILGNAIKELNLPRDELVIMTKVHFACLYTACSSSPRATFLT